MDDSKAARGDQKGWSLEITSAERVNVLLLLAVWLWHWILKILSWNKVDVSSVIQTRQPNELKIPLTHSHLARASRSFATKVSRIVAPLILLNILCQSFDKETFPLLYLISMAMPLLQFSIILGFIWKDCDVVKYCMKRLLLIEPTPRSLRNAYILVSDTLTSFGKPLVDFTLYLIVFFVSKDSLWAHFDILIPLAPLQIRVWQCLREFFLTKDKSLLFNALKYCSSVPIIVYMWYGRVQPNDYNYINHGWFMLFNSCYTSFWDIKMDWKLNSLSKIRSGKNKLDFKLPKAFYYAGVSFNLVIKFWWIWTISGQRHEVFFANELQYFEILRRAVWIVFKLESEYVTMSKSIDEK